MHGNSTRENRETPLAPVAENAKNLEYLPAIVPPEQATYAGFNRSRQDTDGLRRNTPLVLRLWRGDSRRRTHAAAIRSPGSRPEETPRSTSQQRLLLSFCA